MSQPLHIKVNDEIIFGNDLPFVLIAGPCVLESRQHALEMSTSIAKIAQKLDIPFIYKSSFDKANRTSATGERGLGLEASLEIFAEIKEKVGCPIITDVHSAEHCEIMAEVVDVLQIPAFLCRQTDLLKAAAATGKIINIKKGQFLAPWDMTNVAKKMETFGNTNVLLCERGASFGYNTLVSDMRSLPIMAKTGYPVVFDATHSVQQPGGAGTASSGERHFVPVLARAAIAVGVASVFMEVHQDPDNAPSDGPNMLKLQDLEILLTSLKKYDAITKAA
ncbi:3-deoxy-8-phosphooctulonate synthase [Candidatus Paracaedibacter symbiosus]|uniref:3-deoxy-8-phosphooctulonate synthase n=1 Tax=Candidatus Paracaedibacter symbiosus TaxID=244582 RepID=UPI000509963C|nr:3-deoxy-8-phosphooctulonate synthase [Candidatus Paracaedibacter symbiosus]